MQSTLKPIIVLLLSLLLFSWRVEAQEVVIGSKRFTESYVLGEIARQTLKRADLSATHRQGMGGTIIVWEALKSGQIGLYPEYTGTISEEILKSKTPLSLDAMRQQLKLLGVGVGEELGFNNTYAIVMRQEQAKELGIRTISDLRQHPELRAGITHEFLKRQDGWEPLSRRYNFPIKNVRGIDHALGYAALASGEIDLKDAYSTDAKIASNKLVVLEDDLQYFPQYKAVFLYRLNLDPRAITALKDLESTLDETRMTKLNALAEETKNYSLAATKYFEEGKNATTATNAAEPETPLAAQLWQWTIRHLMLVGISLFFSILVGVPLGIIASRPGALSSFILGTVSVIQTVPSLALLALLVPLPFFGISARTAIFALFLYGLLPIVRNTATGLQDIAPGLREAATSLGIEPRAQMRQIFLPLASRSILAGIKTSAVINVGTATIAALIGAGGLGEPIISGLNLNDHRTILMGAIPAAILAIVVQGSFEILDRVLIPKGLRTSTHQRSS
jgi:osmoprotectant transport system permease protein